MKLYLFETKIAILYNSYS